MENYSLNMGLQWVPYVHMSDSIVHRVWNGELTSSILGCPAAMPYHFDLFTYSIFFYIHICVPKYWHICVHTHFYLYIERYTNAYIYIYIHVYLYIHMYIRKFCLMCTFTHKFTQMFASLYMYDLGYTSRQVKMTGPKVGSNAQHPRTQTRHGFRILIILELVANYSWIWLLRPSSTVDWGIPFIPRS